MAAVNGRTEGNPFFVGETVRLLAVEGALSDPGDEPLLTTSQSVRGVIARRLETPAAGGRVHFEHVLIRDTLYDGLTSARRLRLHELVIAALEELDDQRPGDYLAELA